jgi:hypothetical protein
MRLSVVLVVGAVLATACGSEAAETADSIVAPVESAEPQATAPAPSSTVAPTTTAAPVAPTTAAPTTAVPTTTTPDGATLFAFTEAGDIADWGTVNDTVMGGVSSSSASWEAGAMVFSGELSLDNNGGFTSVRGPIVPELGGLLADAGEVVVEAVGDGKTYLLQLRTIDDLLYVQRFATGEGSDGSYRLPLAGFEPVGRFLDPLPGAPALDPSRVGQMVIYLLDKQEGPFRLAVRRIAAA